MKLKLTKGLFAAVMAAFVAAPAMADVTYSFDNVQYGDTLALGETTTSSESPLAITIDAAQLAAVTATTDLVYTHNSPKAGTNNYWGIRALNEGGITGKWNNGNYGDTVDSATMKGLAVEGTITLCATIGNNGVVVVDMNSGKTVYSNGGLKSSSPAVDSYTIEGSGIVTSAKKVISYDMGNLSGDGTLALASNSTISGGGNANITIDLNGKSAIIAGDTTLNKIGAYGAASGGITVKSGITLTAAIDSSWNPGNISLEDNAKIEADHITLSTNAVSNVTGHGSVHVSGNVETFNGGKINTSADIFTVDGNVTLGVKNAGANNSTLTVSGGEFSVAGTTTVNSGRTLTVSGGTATLNDLVIAGGTVNLTGGTTTIDGTVTVNGGTLNMTTATDLTMESVTLNAGNTITLGSDHSGKLTTTALTVNGASTINADLILAQGATVNMTAAVTMGCAVTIEGGTVLTVADTVMTAPVTLFTDVEGLTLGTTTITEMGWYDANGILASVNGVNVTEAGQYVIGFWDGTVSVAEASVPEPATATLSLLALAALAARRKRK